LGGATGLGLGLLGLGATGAGAGLRAATGATGADGAGAGGVLPAAAGRGAACWSWCPHTPQNRAPGGIGV